ncbi:MAG TPA: histidine kinase dimerization/phospho-acceptor domain-containing protein, partial [Alphaproteobacteria bacterium]|nr:histidine kinase dimerization/phospho-acceptor domain-containing protein [Alphaproteobacteria bacterium]
MSARPTKLKGQGGGLPPDAETVLYALPGPVLVVDSAGRVRYVNHDAQEFFDAGSNILIGLPLAELLPADSPLFFLVEQVRRHRRTMADYGVTLETPRIGRHVVTVHAAPLGDGGDHVVLTLSEVSIARKIDHQLTHRHAARSVTAMAAMLAHEVKNPLSGIRGAAQLLEQSASEGDRMFTRLICDEADRIVALVNRMEVFSDNRAIDREAVNIHAVLEHARRVAQNGFARHVR